MANRMWVMAVLAAILLGCEPRAPAPAPAPRNTGRPPEPALDAIKQVEFSPDNELLLTAYGPDFTRGRLIVPTRRTLALWDLKTGKQRWVLHGGDLEVYRGIFILGGKQILVKTGEREVRGAFVVLDAQNGKVVKTLEVEAASVSSFKPFAEGRRVLAGLGDGRLLLLDMTTGEVVRTIKGEGFVGTATEMAVSPDGKLALTMGGGSGDDYSMRLWDLEAGKVIRAFKGADDWCGPFAFAPDGKTAVVAKRGPPSTAEDPFGLEGWKLAFLEMPSGKEIRTLPDNQSWVVVFSPDGKTFVSASRSPWHEQLRRRNVVSGKELWAVWLLEKGDPGVVALSPDGRFAAAGGGLGFEVWDAAEGKRLQVLREQQP